MINNVNHFLLLSFLYLRLFLPQRGLELVVSNCKARNRLGLKASVVAGLGVKAILYLFIPNDFG